MGSIRPIVILSLAAMMACAPARSRSDGSRASAGEESPGEGEGEGERGNDGTAGAEGEGEGQQQEGATEGEGEGAAPAEGEGEGEGVDQECPAGEVLSAAGCVPEESLDAGTPEPQCEVGGEVECDGICVSLETSVQNCGDCDVTCDEVSEICEDGACTYRCEEHEIICNNVCVDIESNSHHCGACGQRCRIGEDCVEQECVTSCPHGHNRCDGRCSNPVRDPGNCGSCGNQCDDWLICRTGACTCDDPATINCNGACEDLSSDRNNCGECGNVCRDDQLCQDGVCGCESEGFIECEGRCVDSFNDVTNCGECDLACEADVECIFGFCGAVREEIEPNNNVETCNPVAAQEWQVTGIVAVQNDRDWFCFSVQDNQAVTFDIDARAAGSSLDSKLYLHAINENGAANQLASNDDRDGLDSRIDHQFNQGGRYAIEVGAFGERGCAACTYTLHLR